MSISPAASKARLRPERVLDVSENISLVEVIQDLEDGGKRVAGYYVYGDDGASVLHASLAEAETDFLRRTWR